MSQADQAGGGRARSHAEAGGFRAFDARSARRHWGAPLLTSTGVYLALIAAAFVLGNVTRNVVSRPPVEVTFVEKIIKEEPPPPPPPEPAKVVQPPKPAAPAAMAPVVRPHQKVRKLDKPPPAKELVAPREMPQEVPKEADPSEDKGVAVFGEPGRGDPAGLEGGATHGGVIGGQVGGAIDLPDGATPPIPLASNKMPRYPDRARNHDQSGAVIVKLTILADGSVADVEVIEGAEPFVTAAVKTLKTWRYKPARFKGQPISVFKKMRVSFQMEG